MKDFSAVEFLENRTLEHKTGAIERLMRLVPGRRFAFVGDSGEKDPEVYAGLAARFPQQVVAILIRDVTGEDVESARYKPLFSTLAPHIQRRVFRDVRELSDVILRAALIAGMAGIVMSRAGLMPAGWSGASRSCELWSRSRL